MVGVDRGASTLCPSVIVGITTVPSSPAAARRARFSLSSPPSMKGTNFVHPFAPHERWHIDAA